MFLVINWILPPAPPPDPNYPVGEANPWEPFAKILLPNSWILFVAENQMIPPPLPPRLKFATPLPPPEPSYLASPW